jgi:hypothetical protein
MTAVARLFFFLLFATAVHAAEPWEAFFDPFLGDLKSELADAKAAGKKGVVIMYGFDDCPYCNRMKHDVLARPEVQQRFQGDFTVVWIDTRGAQPVTGIDGRTVPEKDLAKTLGIRATTNGISSVRGATGFQPASCRTCSSVTFLPSQLRSTDSRTMRMETGRRSIFTLSALPSAGSE